jgi:FAD-dependent urate hydroxylase
MTMSDVLVIGAGPFGLSISAHLRDRGVEHTIVGKPMDTWRNHMPLGLFLKSEPYGSGISAAKRGYDIGDYASLFGLSDYSARVGPLSLDRFLAYADWFTQELVPDIQDLTVTSVTPSGGGFKVEFAEEAPVFARQVIVATGLLPYVRVPSELSGLPADLMTHSTVHRTLDQFLGKRVALIGGGQSSLQTAALLHEMGVDVRVVMRKDHIYWEQSIKPEIGLIDRLRRPPVRLCEGWACVAHDYPEIFRRLPEDYRVIKATTSFGPAGAWWLRDRVEGVVEVLTGSPVNRAEPFGSGVRLHLGGAKPKTMDVDHVMAGTGFRIDVATLPFLAEEIKSNLMMRAGCPLVSRAGESTVDGLYFAGAHTMVSYGAGVRFISGTHHTAAHIARSVARHVRREARPAEPDAPAASPRALTTTGPLSVS